MRFGLFDDVTEIGDLFREPLDEEFEFNIISDLFAVLNLNDEQEETNRKRNKMGKTKPPAELVVNSDIDMSQEWTEWLGMYEDYFIAKKLGDEGETIQVANFRSCVGREAVKVLNNLNLTDEQ